MSPKPPAKPRVLSSGKLRIGDEWNAINIIARTQTHPLKAICELTENALDAGAGEIVIVRRREHDDVYLEVNDDGAGVKRDDAGLPDFGRIATHLCDSMKRHLEEQERKGIHGEFGIGLLSFWGLGETLRIVSPGADGRLYEMQLGRGARTYTVRPVRGQISTGGTRVTVGPLLPATRNLVTGEKLQRYLSEELRDRIRSRQAKVRIFDRFAHKQYLVEPREFVGERLPLPQRWKTRYGELSIELYYHDSEEAEAGIAVCKDGTRVLRHISELEDFQHAPWTDRRLSGVIDYPALNLAPGTRSGIVPDERLVGFAAAVLQAEAAVARELSSREEAESARASRDILKQVHKAFVSALNELPANEYLFFDIPKSRAGAGKSADDRQLAAGVLESEQDAAVTVRGAADEDLGQKLLPLTPGPLGAVRITPRNSRREVRTECVLSAAVFDDIGIPLDTEVKCQWHIQEGKGRFVSAAGQQCTVTASEPGHLVISVEATQKSVRVSDQVVVKFVPETGLGKDDSGRGLPSYRLESESGRPWRSRYDVERNEIIINSAHRDFIASQGTPAKHRRYVGKLYAKEVVLINFPHGAPGDVLERLVEITLRTEDVL